MLACKIFHCVISGQLSHMLSIHTSDPSFISIWHSYNMAEAVLEIVLENLKSILQKELGQFLGVDDDMKRLASLFTTIKATLEDAEEKQFSNRVIKDWLAKLKDESLILDDILEEFDLLDKVQGSYLSSFHPKHVVFR